MTSNTQNLPETAGHTQGPYSHYRQTPQPKPDDSPALASAALIMAVCALIFMSSGAFFFFASLGILFALLSRGSGPMKGTARTALALSVAAFVVGSLLLGGIAAVLFRSGGDNPYMEQFQEYFEYYMNGTEPASGVETESGDFI